MPLPLDRPPQMLVNSYAFETLCPENVSENSRSRLAYGSGKSVHVSVVNSRGEVRIVDRSVLMEVEKLRRANVALVTPACDTFCFILSHTR